MRSKRDNLFLAVFVLACVATISVAAIAASGAKYYRPTASAQGGGAYTGDTQITTGSGGSTTTTTGGSSGGAGGSGGVGGPGGGGSGGGGTTGVSGDTIKIGGIFSEGGGIDATVEEDTVRACFNLANSQGGINGHKLQLISYNDNNNGDNAANEAAELDQKDHVFAIVGWLAPFGEASAAPYFESKGIPIVGGLGVPEEFNNQYSFPVSPIFVKDGYALGAFATNPNGPLHFKHPGVFLTQTAGIQDVANGIMQAAAANHVTVSNNDIVYVSFAQPNFDNYLLQFQADGVDGLITQIDPFSYYRLYQSEQRTNKVFPHLGGAGLDKQSVDSQIGAPLHGTYDFMPFLEAQGNPTGNPEIALYLNTLAHYYPDQMQNVDAFSEGSWVSCRVFEQALAKLGSNVTRQGLIQALNSGVYSTRGMAPDLNYGAAGSTHAAAHCASYTTYTSSNRWQLVTGGNGFVCY